MKAISWRTAKGSKTQSMLIALAIAWILSFAFPFEPTSLHFEDAFAPPSISHPFGCGENGIDLFRAVLGSVASSSLLAFAVCAIAMIFGAFWGLASAIAPPPVERILQTTVTAFQSVPALVIHAVLLTALLNPSFMQIALVLAVPSWMIYARIAHARTSALREADYLKAARLLGVQTIRRSFRHLSRKVLRSLVVQAATSFSGIILAEASLSFLGFLPVFRPSFGVLIDQGVVSLYYAPHVLFFSSIPLIALTLMAQKVAEELRASLSP